MSTSSITHSGLFQKAWPIILANSAVPLLGLVDTFVIGNKGDVPQLGAIALGALIFNFIYWGFGFLRMSTTGFIAQAAGAGEEAEVRATLGRALLIALSLGSAMIALQWPLQKLAFILFSASPSVESIAQDYFFIRVWAAPATLCLYGLMGTLIGLGRSRDLLLLQLLLNGINIALDVLFAGVLDWGAKGIAFGTFLAEWITLAVAALVVFRILRGRHNDDETFWPWQRLIDRQKLLHTLDANTNILIRTLLLLFSFAWFTNQSALLGDAVLGANHILLQIVSFSAFFLDGFAYVAEALVGKAIGEKNRSLLTQAIRKSSELAAATALLLAVGIVGAGDFVIDSLTTIESVRQAASQVLLWVALYVLCSVAAFQLDGIFIGATKSREMRNAALLSTTVFMFAWWLLLPFGNGGLWMAFVVYVVARAGALGIYYPAFLRNGK